MRSNFRTDLPSNHARYIIPIRCISLPGTCFDWLNNMPSASILSYLRDIEVEAYWIFHECVCAVLFSICSVFFNVFQYLQCFFFSLLPGTFLTDWIIYLSFPIRGLPPQQKRKEYFTNVYDVCAGQWRPREIIFNMCVSPIPPSSANNQQ